MALLYFMDLRCIFLFVFGFWLPIFAPLCSSSSLYLSDDPLWELDAQNYERVVIGKNNAWIIEFYNSWCGHCIRFVPTWKSFSRDIQTWKNVIDVAVVNCADSVNLKLCRNFEVESYPTIRFFWTNVNKDTKGTPLTGDKDVDSMRHSVIKYLETNWKTGVPERWPRLEPIKSESLDELWRDVPEKERGMVVIVEKPESWVGREVILDFSFQKHSLIRRVLSTNVGLLSQIKNYENDNETTVLKLQRDGTEELLHKFPRNTSESFMRNRIFEILAGYKRSSYSLNLPPDQSLQPQGSGGPSGVYAVDLENALGYTLRQEIGVHQNIAGPKLNALKAFILALRKFFPGSASLKTYLYNVYNWVNNQTFNISGESFQQALDDLQTDKEHLPEMREWVGCKGSKPGLRGYPCSLWTLFHTLTVQAYLDYQDDPIFSTDNPREILYVIREYVKHFFTCEDCSQHFQTMSANLDKEARNPQDTVLWLWNAHNKVNQRLAGDATEDPQHPKVQFPTLKLCNLCHSDTKRSTSDTTKWNTNAVLRFLLTFYNKNNIITDINNPKLILDDSKLTNESLSDMMKDNQRGIAYSPWAQGTTSLIIFLNLLLLATEV